MKTYVAPGEVVPFTVAGANLLSGAGVKVGDAFYVATMDGLIGAVINGLRTGVVELPKVSAQAWTEGQQLNWDNTAKLVTTVTTANFRIGYAYAAAANPTATGKVVLHGGNLGAALA